MSLILATGSNQGNRELNLERALNLLSKEFQLIKKSRVYESSAVDYEEQPDFYNQVLEFVAPDPLRPLSILKICNTIEAECGRMRTIPKGPRIIDIDILFIGNLTCQLDNLEIPHPRLFSRSFVVYPLQELPYFEVLKTLYQFPKYFEVQASPL